MLSRMQISHFAWLIGIKSLILEAFDEEQYNYTSSAGPESMATVHPEPTAYDQNYVPKPEVMDRDGRPPLAKKGIITSIFCPCIGRTTTAGTRFARNEIVFYDSAKARRTLLGKMHYCLACPGWSKLTTQRVVYSRWDLIPIAEVPNATCAICCDCGGSQADWLPPDTGSFRTTTGENDECRVPCGRTLDTFDSDIVVDASAHQTLCQICRNEGDVVLYRKAGADLSDSSEVFVLPDVVSPFDVFNDVTFELSKINLQGATSSALGARMGATIWGFDARAGADGPSSKPWRGDKEFVFYDSLTARRTCLGYLCNAECCYPPIYKVRGSRGRTHAATRPEPPRPRRASPGRLLTMQLAAAAHSCLANACLADRAGHVRAGAAHGVGHVVPVR